MKTPKISPLKLIFANESLKKKLLEEKITTQVPSWVHFPL